MKTPEEQDDLWQLLGKAKVPAVSPFFARNVLREIRSSRQEKAGVFAWFIGHKRLVSLGGFAAVLLALNATPYFAPRKDLLVVVPKLPAQEVAVAQNTPTRTDYEVIKNLDELVAYEDHSIWLDDSAQ